MEQTTSQFYGVDVCQKVVKSVKFNPKRQKLDIMYIVVWK